PEGAKQVRLTVELTSPVEMVRRRHPVMIDEWGISNFEWLGDPKKPEAYWRWALAPKTELAFEVTSRKEILVQAKFRTPLEHQVVDIDVDGKPLTTWSDIRRDELELRSFHFTAEAGRHLIKLHYALANVGRTSFAPGDPRPMAIMLESLV